MRGVVVPGADPPSLNSVEAKACPLSSFESRPAPSPDRLLFSCSADMAVRNSQSYSCCSCNNIDSSPSK